MNRAIACAIHTRYHKCGQVSTTHDTKARVTKNATNQKKLNKKTFDKPFPQRVHKHTHKCQQVRQNRKCAHCAKEHKPTLANVDMRDKTGNALAAQHKKKIHTHTLSLIWVTKNRTSHWQMSTQAIKLGMNSLHERTQKANWQVLRWHRTGHVLLVSKKKTHKKHTVKCRRTRQNRKCAIVR